MSRFGFRGGDGSAAESATPLPAQIAASAGKTERYSPTASIWFVSMRDLLHEPLLTTCLILSIVAVLVPLMLLWSVKIGFVERIRADLIADPAFREIRPVAADIRQPEELDSFRTFDGVRYLVPSVMLVPREVTLLVPDRSKTGQRNRNSRRPKTVQMKLIPTSAGDPLHDKVAGRFDSSDPDAVIITSDIADRFGITSGDELQLVVSRIENRRTRRVRINVRITGILPEELRPLPSILASSEIDQAVENYRAGISVPSRGWHGVRQAPKQAYEGILIASPRPLDDTERRDLELGIGAVSFAQIAGPNQGPAALYELIGLPSAYFHQALFAMREGITHVYLMRNSAGATISRWYSATDLAEAKERAVKFAGYAFGLNPPADFSMGELRFTGVAVDPLLFTGMRELFYPWRINRAAKLAPNLGLYLSETAKPMSLGGVEARFENVHGKGPSVALPVEIEGYVNLPDQTALVSPALVGMLQRGRQVPLAYDPANNTLVEQISGFRGFRLVAETLEDVPTLVEQFADRSIKVRAKSDAIIKLQRLDRSLNFLVLAVGAVALVGGICVACASFIASIKRKAVTYAVFRLLGVSKSQVFQIPVIQAIIVSAVAFIVSVIVYFIVSFGINSYIAQLVNFDGQLSRVDAHHFVTIAILVVTGSVIASLVAAREATAIDPSIALKAA